MKAKVLKIAMATAFLTGAAPAFADLIYKTGTQTTGTGLGAVSTVVTVQDNGKGQGQGNENGTESGCVSYNSAKPNKPNETCPTAAELGGPALEGGDNTAGSGGNNTYFLNQIAGLTSAGQLGLVVNISEGQPGNTATLTDLFLSLYNTSSGMTSYYRYTGPNLALTDSGGIGQSGDHYFILDDIQAAAAASFCPTLSQCVIGGGIQFANGTTQATPETMYVGAFKRVPGNPGGGEVPEPGSLALLGAGAMAFGALRRRYSAKK